MTPITVTLIYQSADFDGTQQSADDLCAALNATFVSLVGDVLVINIGGGEQALLAGTWVAWQCVADNNRMLMGIYPDRATMNQTWAEV
jgi:hypothetical protein